MASILARLAACWALIIMARSAAYAEEDLGDLGARRPPSAQAQAEPQAEYGRPGAYGIVAGTIASSDFHDRLDGSGGGDGFNLRAGYRWHPNLAGELEFERLTDLGNVDVWTLTAAGKAYLSTGRLQPFGVLGLGAFDAESSDGNRIDDTEFGVSAGAGVDFYITEHFALDLEAAYNFSRDNLDDLRYTTVSMGLLLKL